nr:MAG TPA: hypothetical protein [Caudoviricetes sp.]
MLIMEFTSILLLNIMLAMKIQLYLISIMHLQKSLRTIRKI